MGHTRPKLIIFSGLPGSGKSTLADYASTSLSIPIIAKDWIEASLWRSNINDNMGSGRAAYNVMTSLAAEQLERKVSIILDSVATFERIREEWRTIAAKHDAEFLVVECICSDEATHRKRIESRQRNIVGWPELTWDDVTSAKSQYEPWTGQNLVLDAMNNLDENRKELLGYLSEVS